MIHIREQLQKHFWYYVSLVGLQGIGLLLLYITGTNTFIQVVSIVFMSFVYIFWASYHHYFHHNLTPKIVVEYVLMGLLGMVVSLFLIQPI
jgi:hypothetical protein